MKRSASSRQCPACNRKSALVRFSEDWGFGVGCRWCGYESATLQPYES